MASSRGGQIEVDSDDDRAGEEEGEEEEEEEEEEEDSLLEMRKSETWMLEHGHFSDVRALTCLREILIFAQITFMIAGDRDLSEPKLPPVHSLSCSMR